MDYHVSLYSRLALMHEICSGQGVRDLNCLIYHNFKITFLALQYPAIANVSEGGKESKCKN
jgi:hypothetical protein